ncbi:unnamed protein product [Callosobruchus maculatus]|uniref:Uncharacterized protein n=1 Tax=Callosobruchus maculatus TaxID=64391 RepID=A0A653D8V1_CALMS|nr:unnamed protein product [Callosobruchus maculatus]
MMVQGMVYLEWSIRSQLVLMEAALEEVDTELEWMEVCTVLAWKVEVYKVLECSDMVCKEVKLCWRSVRCWSTWRWPVRRRSRFSRGRCWYREWYTWSGVLIASWPQWRLRLRRSIRCRSRWRSVWCWSTWRWRSIRSWSS